MATLGLWLLVQLMPVADIPAIDGSIWHQQQWTDLVGRSWNAEALDGRVVLLDFWATWCAPCVAQLPDLRRLHAKYRDRGFVFLGIALDSLDRRRLRAFLLRHNVTWPQIHDPSSTQGPIARRFGVEAIPATILVDTRGRIIARDLHPNALDLALETLLSSGR